MPASAKRDTASHFPSMRSTRRMGFSNNGNRDRRSRSPAIVSIAIFMPPTKAATSVKTDIMPTSTVASDARP